MWCVSVLDELLLVGVSVQSWYMTLNSCRILSGHICRCRTGLCSLIRGCKCGYFDLSGVRISRAVSPQDSEVKLKQRCFLVLAFTHLDAPMLTESFDNIMDFRCAKTEIICIFALRNNFLNWLIVLVWRDVLLSIPVWKDDTFAPSLFSPSSTQLVESVAAQGPGHHLNAVTPVEILKEKKWATVFKEGFSNSSPWGLLSCMS